MPKTEISEIARGRANCSFWHSVECLHASCEDVCCRGRLWKQFCDYEESLLCFVETLLVLVRQRHRELMRNWLRLSPRCWIGGRNCCCYCRLSPRCGIGGRNCWWYRQAHMVAFRKELLWHMVASIVIRFGGLSWWFQGGLSWWFQGEHIYRQELTSQRARTLGFCAFLYGI